jgi:hypothetical protein
MNALAQHAFVLQGVPPERQRDAWPIEKEILHDLAGDGSHQARR